jgi:hypothetical protein
LDEWVAVKSCEPTSQKRDVGHPAPGTRAGVEGRVEVDEVDGVVGEVVAEDGEVVAVIELVLLVGRGGRHA